jgi:hypothetical protein
MHFILLLSLFVSSAAFAQMTLPSVFPDMKSVNPAVISLRKQGQIRVSGQHDQINKRQEVLEDDGSRAFLEKNEISLTNTNFFMAGKGDGFTSELYVDFTKGERTTFLDQGGQETDYITDTSSYYVGYAFATKSRYGLEMHYVGYQAEYDYNFSFGSEDYAQSIDTTISVYGFRPGVIFGSPKFSLALFAEHNFFTSKTKMDPEPEEGAGSGPDPAFSVVGVAIGGGSPSGLFEIGIEVDPISKREKDQNTGVTPVMPMKVSLLAEKRFSSFIIGYKFMGYKGNYLELDKIIQNQLVYSSQGSDTRMEHVINFAFGGSKGFSFGASGSYSDTEIDEKSSLDPTGEDLYPTKVRSFSVGLRLGYVY